MMIVETDGLPVTANFQETQLTRMRLGQQSFTWTHWGKDFQGTVERMPAATGSITRVLPPENATGNYVKVA